MESPKAKKNLSDDERLAIYRALLASSESGKLKHGSVKDVAAQFEVSRHTVMRVWQRGQSSVVGGAFAADVRSKIKGNSGRKVYDKEELQSIVAAVPKHKRVTFRQLESATGLSKSVLHGAMKKGTIIRRSSWIKPYLTPRKNKMFQSFQNMKLNQM